MKKHLLVISQYFYPEQFRINDICIEWVKRGYKVTVITGIPNYPQGSYYEGYGLFKKRSEIYEGINIKRLFLIPRGNSSAMLVMNYLSFVFSGFLWKCFTKIKADFVFIFEVTPMTQALPGVWYAKKRKIPCYIYVTDLWPENVVAVTGIENKYIIKSIGTMVDYIYKKCDKIFTASESFVKVIAQRGVDEKKIEFWPQYAEDYYKALDADLDLVPEIPDNDIFNILFAGNIGYAQGLGILLEVASILKAEGLGVRFNILGDGRYKTNLIKSVYENGLQDMFNFIEKQPATRVAYFMAVCDAALICLSNNLVFSISLPAKTQSCLACGRPILVSANGEIQDVINSAAAGLYSNAGDAKGLADNIKKMLSYDNDKLLQMSLNAVDYCNKNYSKEKLLKQMDKYFQ